MEGIKEAAKRLWQECFDDEQSFVDFYFEKVFKEDECKLYYEEGGTTDGCSEQGKAVAHIHLPKYKFALSKGLDVEAVYISGACTSKDKRGQGIMDKLLKEALKEAYESGDIAASFLIPASQEVAGYYSKHFGYEPLLYRREVTDPLAICYTTEDIELGERFGEIIPFLMHCEEEMQEAHIKHTAHQWENILAEYKLNPDTSFVFTFSNDDFIQGVVLGRLNKEEKIVFVDGFYGSAEAKEKVMQGFLNYQGCKLKAKVCSSERSANALPYIMMRVLNPLPFLLVYALRNKETELTFNLEDELIEENNKTYHIVNGQVQEIEAKVETTYSMQEFVRNFVAMRHIAFLHE